MTTKLLAPRSGLVGTVLTSAQLQRLWDATMANRGVRFVLLALSAVLCAFLSWKAVDNQLTQTLFGLDPHDSIRRFLAGTQAKPFAYRVFTPALIYVAQYWLHIPALAQAAPAFIAHKVPTICARYGAGQESSCGNIISYFVVGWALFLGFLLTMFVMAKRLFNGNLLLAAGTVYLSFALVNAILLRGLSHTYDWGTLLFGALFLLCLLAERPILFCLVMVVACFNKETAILFGAPFFLANLDRLGPRRTIALCAVQLLTFIVIYGGLRLHFAHNPGTWMEIHLREQIYLFSEHIDLPLLFGLLTAIILVFYRFPDKDPTLRAACIIMPPWFALYLVGAVDREIRDTFEIVPLLVLLTMQSLVALVGHGTASRRPGIEVSSR